MKKLLLLVFLLGGLMTAEAQNRYENQFTRPLGEVLEEVADHFDVKLSIDAKIEGLEVPYADFRIRPYSLDETLWGILGLFDLRYLQTGEKSYKIQPFEFMRRTIPDGEKMTAYLLSLYTDRKVFEERAEVIRREVREKLEIDPLLEKRVEAAPILSKIRKYDGYTVQNFALETLPGLYVCGSIYAPAKKGTYPVIISPCGHFHEGRYRKDQQLRMATFARMGAIAVDYDLFGYAESEHQVSSAAHRTPYAATIQMMNGISILDYILTRADADKSRIGVTGASGGGQQSVVLSVIDDRYTALCPVVSLSSYFDGGCPCESGMPITTAANGTCNAEMAAIFAPKPLCVISDGKDWTKSVPTVEYPYLEKVYAMYDAADKLSNAHFGNEGHDYGVSKREAAYAFFAKSLGMDSSKVDESKVTVVPTATLLSFGKKGELMPESAIRSVNKLAPYFGKDRVRAAAADESVYRKAEQIIAKLNLTDERAIGVATTAVYNHRRAVRDWHNANPYTTIPEVDKATGKKLSKVEREMMADRKIPIKERERLMKSLKSVLTEEQIEQVFDEYTVGKVAFTMQGYRAIVPDMTAEDEKVLLGHLKQARSEAIDCKSMKAISQVFEIHKTKCEQHFTDTGRPWRGLFKAYVDKRNAEKKAAADDKKYIDRSAAIVEPLKLDAERAAAVTELVKAHRTAVVEWHNAHPYTTIPEIDAKTGRKLNEVEREMLADQQIPASVRKELLKGLKKLKLTDEQLIQLWDGYTIGKVDFTMKGYYAIVPDLTEKEAAAMRKLLEKAREEALECRRMKGISQVFEVYKTQCEQYLNANGRNWKALFKAYVDKRNAEKKAAAEAAKK